MPDIQNSTCTFEQIKTIDFFFYSKFEQFFVYTEGGPLFDPQETKYGKQRKTNKYTSRASGPDIFKRVRVRAWLLKHVRPQAGLFKHVRVRDGLFKP